MTNLEKIDLAVNTTFNKYRNSVPDSNTLYSGIIEALIKAITSNNFLGFTRENDARESISSLDNFSFKTELLRNIPKLISYKKINNDPAINHVFGCDLSRLDDIEKNSNWPVQILVEAEIFRKLEECISAPEKYNEIYSLLNNEKILMYLVNSFVSSRYMANLSNFLDQNASMDKSCQQLLNSIDVNYMRTLSETNAFQM